MSKCLVCLVNPTFQCGDCGKWFCGEHIIPTEVDDGEYIHYGLRCGICEEIYDTTYNWR